MITLNTQQLLFIIYIEQFIFDWICFLMLSAFFLSDFFKIWVFFYYRSMVDNHSAEHQHNGFLNRSIEAFTALITVKVCISDLMWFNVLALFIKNCGSFWYWRAWIWLHSHYLSTNNVNYNPTEQIIHTRTNVAYTVRFDHVAYSRLFTFFPQYHDNPDIQ